MGREKSVGFEYLLQLYKETQKTINTSYKGISLRKQDNNSFYLRFKTNDGVRRDWPTGLKLTQDGLLKVIDYARLIHEKLKTYKSELEFENWYNETIRGINNRKNTNINSNEITFKQAIDNLYDWFMAQTDRRGHKRKNNLISSKNSFDGTYNGFFKSLPLDKPVNLDDCLTAVNSYYPRTSKKLS